MRRLGIVVALILSLGLLGVARATVPCTRVDPTTAGSYLVWVQNNTTKNLVEFILVFTGDAKVTNAIGINGTNKLAITGEGGVWTVKLDGAGLKPGGFLLVAVTLVESVTVKGCADLVRLVFPF